MRESYFEPIITLKYLGNKGLLVIVSVDFYCFDGGKVMSGKYRGNGKLKSREMYNRYPAICTLGLPRNVQ